MSIVENWMLTEDQIQRYYDVGRVHSIAQTDHNGVWMLDTTHGRFVAKLGQREDHLRLHFQAQQALQDHGLHCNHVVPTAEDALLTPKGLAIFTWVPGESIQALDASRCDAVFTYLPAYFRALAAVPCVEGDFCRRNGWDDAQSLDYLLKQFPLQLADMPLTEVDRAVLAGAVDRLRIEQIRLQTLQRQLIHADLGPDNFLFDGSQVTAVIDFTPAYDCPLYAVAQFVYWNDLYPNPCTPRNVLLERLHAFAPGAWSDGLMMAMLLRATLYRAAGPLLEMAHAGDVHQTRLRPRIECIRALLS